MLSEPLLQALVTLAVAVDPISLAPVLIALTTGMQPSDRRQVAWRACAIAFCVLVVTVVIGEWLLDKLGISLPAFRIAGGLLLFWLAFEMVYSRQGSEKTQTAQEAVTRDHIRHIAAFPLAIPLIAGPGTITATILFAGQMKGDPMALGLLVGVIAVVICLCWIVFRLAEPIDRLLGTTGNVVLSRLFGVLLAALAVQFVIDGMLAVLRA